MQPTAITYEIILQETYAAQWAAWFEGARLEDLDGSRTRLCGALPDQAALHGVLERIRDLNLRLVSVHVWESNEKGK